MLKIKDVLMATQGALLCGNRDGRVVGVSTDSKTIRPGELFFALRGQNFDGHSFIEEVVEKGASGAVVEKGRVSKFEISLIEVDDTLKALGDLAHLWRGRHPVPLIAISGSCGKTTTKEMIASILRLSHVILQTEGNLNNLIGLPLTLFRLNNLHKMAVVELGISRPGEMRRLVEICQPDIGVLTNIGEAHLATLGDVRGVASGKGELFQGLKGDGVAVVNRDDPWVVKMAEGIKARRVTYSLREKADVYMRDYSQEGPDRLRATFISGGKATTFVFKGCGIYSLYNCAAAIATTLPLGVGRNEIKEGLSRFRPLYGRTEVIRLNNLTFINDTYNANPTSTEASLRALASMGTDLKSVPTRRIAVLGDMLELGEMSLDAHRRIGGLCHNLGIDILFLIGDFKSDVAQGAIEAGMGNGCIHLCNSRREITTLLADTLKEGDVVLVKGSRAMGMEEVVKQVQSSKFKIKS